MRDESLLSDVLSELGDDRLRELAGELGTDPRGAETVVEATVSALPASTGEGTLAGVMGRISAPTAVAVAERTGLPVDSVSRALELLLPVVLSVIADHRRARK
ncbi:DUF937 domain-containing protein [Streptomyces sp. NPDC051776]|uniref:DUF937 domain-containing protein n=1 Tax=Streptomyces sp. NPDC051776 TaxID=3155414 RepID=UPI003414450C